MRPSDENQRGSTRPKLKSARRLASADGNILATLERLSRRPGSGAARHKAVWLSAAGALVLVLVGAIAWLAHVNATTLRPLPLADARGRALPDAPVAPAASAARLPATIIDEPAERAVLLAQAGPPPLVMLKPAAGERKPAPVPAERAPRPKAADVKPAAPAARTAVAKNAAPVPRKPRAPAAKVEPEQEPVDSDVALLSAILAQSSRHAAERAKEEAKAAPKP